MVRIPDPTILSRDGVVVARLKAVFKFCLWLTENRYHMEELAQVRFLLPQMNGLNFQGYPFKISPLKN